MPQENRFRKNFKNIDVKCRSDGERHWSIRKLRLFYGPLFAETALEVSTTVATMIFQFRVQIVLLLFFFSISADTLQESDYDQLVRGLVEPIHYNLSLLIDMEKLTTVGEVSILLKVLSSSLSRFCIHMDKRFLSLRKSDGGIEIGMEVVSTANDKQNIQQDVVEKEFTIDQWNRLLGHNSQKKFNLHIIEVPEPLRPVEGDMVRLVVNFAGRINRRQYRGLFEIQVYAINVGPMMPTGKRCAPPIGHKLVIHCTMGLFPFDNYISRNLPLSPPFPCKPFRKKDIKAANLQIRAKMTYICRKFANIINK